MRREARFARTVSMHGRNENWIQHPDIPRSHSTPELLEDGVFRFIPATPTDAHGTPTVEAVNEDTAKANTQRNILLVKSSSTRKPYLQEEMRREARFARTVSMHGRNENWIQHPDIPRSHSAPELLEAELSNALGFSNSEERLDQLIVSQNLQTPLTNSLEQTLTSSAAAEEAVVCRICMDELHEGALKLACNCKGELGLAHKDCATKWFSRKGNRICEICNQKVMNVRVMHTPTTYRVWQDAPILLIVSMLAYISFLGLFLVTKMDKRIAISLPFGCILGLVGSMIATTIMVRRRYAWIYATVQFILVVCFAIVFISKLHLTVILSILLATFVGFGGGAMCGTSFIYVYLKWRESNQHPTPDIEQPPQPSHA